jgi:hypothetical protein
MKKTQKLIVITAALAVQTTAVLAPVFLTDATIGVGNATYDGQDIVVGNCTLTVNGPHSFASLLLTNGAVLTHSPAPNGEADNRLDLIIASDLAVDATSIIDASAKGYGTDAGPGAGVSRTSGGSYESGGGHGGPGGNGYGVAGGGSYDDLFAPVQWGSGGGNRFLDCACPGGVGGGRIKLNVGGVLMLNGQLSANGQSAFASGGAGGSIHILAGMLAGNGSITANGGDAGHGWSGGGGGGRIAIYYGSSIFSGTLTAFGGFSSYANSGGAGTIYTKANGQSFGDLLLDNTGRTNAMETPLNTPIAYRLTVTNATASANTPLTLAGLRISANGLLTHPFRGPRLQAVVHGSAIIEAGGAIAADARGYPAATGPGHGLSSTWYDNSGAGHGGVGGNGGWMAGPGGGTYDSITAPILFGSGGGGGHGQNRGGGAIQLAVDAMLTINGTISVNADPADPVNGGYDGGGSGGSVWLTATRLTGAGTITANGQPASYYLSGSGGGGRIAVYTGINQFTGFASADGGIGGYQSGGNGSVYFSTNVPSSLASWWPGENSAEDIIAGRNGTLLGGAAFASGVVGQAFNFTSDGDGVSIPYDPALDVSPSGFTVEFWMQGVKNQPQSLFLVVDKSHGWVDSTGWLFQGYSGSGQIFFGIGAGGSTIDNFPGPTSSTDVLDGQWHHVAGTWDGALLRIFVDGVQQGQAALTTPFNNTRPVNLGFSWGNGTPLRFFRGKVDELMLFNRALGADEIAANYAANASRVLPRPTLAVTSTNGGVMLTWPVIYASYSLVSCADLSVGNWETVTNVPASNGVWNEVALPATTTEQCFFRLQLVN